MIAALYVAKDGCYFNLPNVDPWDEARDAMNYQGPWPVVAHPPCARWCRLAGLVEARGGPKRGEDGGTFAAALGAVERWGGVLEHPSWTKAWAAYGLDQPTKDGLWTPSRKGHVAWVYQRQYGHKATKGTWLYAVNCELPVLIPGKGPKPEAGWCYKDKAQRNTHPGGKMLSQKDRLATPLAFRDLLLAMARSVNH